jgi:hypothetical protein
MSSPPPSAISLPAKTLDGEGGYCVYGKLMPAADSLAQRALPLGLAHGVKLKRSDCREWHRRWDDVDDRRRGWRRRISSGDGSDFRPER